MSSVNSTSPSQEAKFNLEELFFSITQLDSQIICGNETFIRVSEYKEEEIVGKYHNLVRHPDMPKVLFSVFWDFLHLGKPVVAYVKNRTKNGNYYWVLAAIFPLGEKYISIRIKPSTTLFTKIREIYFRVLMLEAKLDEQEVKEEFVALLKELGFDDYEQFMQAALLAELLERKELLGKKELPPSHESHLNAKSHIRELCEASNTLFNEYSNWFAKIDSLAQVKFALQEKGLLLRTLGRDIVFLSLNASVASYKLESDGETFGVLASDIRVNAKENDAIIEKIHKSSNSLSSSLDKMIFLVSCANLQMEMITYFLRELLVKEEANYQESIYLLYELVSKQSLEIANLFITLEKYIEESILCLDELEQQVMYLGYVQIYGIIESARSNDDKLGFKEIFSQLKALIAKTSDEVLIMRKISDNFSLENKNFLAETEIVKKMLEKFENSIKLMQSESL